MRTTLPSIASLRAADTLVHLLMRADAFQQDRVLRLVPHKPKHDSQIGADRTRPRVCQPPLQFVRPERRLKRIAFKSGESLTECGGDPRPLLHQPPGQPQKRTAGQKSASHFTTRRITSPASTGFSFPAAHSRPALRTAASNCTRRLSAIRRRRVSATCSCSSKDRRSNESSRRANPFMPQPYFHASPASTLICRPLSIQGFVAPRVAGHIGTGS